jgi:hypothetical protein
MLTNGSLSFYSIQTDIGGNASSRRHDGTVSGNGVVMVWRRQWETQDELASGQRVTILGNLDGVFLCSYTMLLLLLHDFRRSGFNSKVVLQNSYFHQ